MIGEDTRNETIEVRLQRIMKSEDSSAKWRALFVKGGEHWLSLKRQDMDLLVFCGCPTSILSKHETLFKIQEEPLVKLIEDRGKYTLAGVWYKDRHITYSEGNEIVTQSKLEPSNTSTIEELNTAVDKMIEKFRGEREKQRSAEQTILAPEDEAREGAELYNNIFMHIDALMDKFGRVELVALWRYRQSGQYLALPNKPGNIHEAVSGLSLKSREYTLALAHVVDRIFSEVEALTKAGKPFMNPNLNIPITVDYLIITPGLIQKLKQHSQYYASLIDYDSKQKFMGWLVTETVVKMKALVDEGSKVTDTANLIPVKIEAIPNSDKSRLTFDVTPAQLIAVQRALRPLLGEISQ